MSVDVTLHFPNAQAAADWLRSAHDPVTPISVAQHQDPAPAAQHATTNGIAAPQVESVDWGQRARQSIVAYVGRAGGRTAATAREKMLKEFGVPGVKEARPDQLPAIAASFDAA